MEAFLWPFGQFRLVKYLWPNYLHLLAATRFRALLRSAWSTFWVNHLSLTSFISLSCCILKRKNNFSDTNLSRLWNCVNWKSCPCYIRKPQLRTFKGPQRSSSVGRRPRLLWAPTWANWRWAFHKTGLFSLLLLQRNLQLLLCIFAG